MKKKIFWIGFGLGGAVLGAAMVKRRRQMNIQNWKIALASQTRHTALVTGASSGIGEAYAQRLASLGYSLVLVARRKERLNELADQLRQHFGTKSEVLPADLTTPEGIEIIEQRIRQGGDIDFLVNSAGFGLPNYFAETSIESVLDMINCHTLASVRLTRAALPAMITRRHGAVINLSSVASFVPMPRNVTYSATKEYLNAFTEALHTELRGSGVRVQALCPGYTHTGFHDAPQFAEIREYLPAWLWSVPEGVVDASLASLKLDQVVCIPGWQNKFIVTAARMGLISPLLSIYAGFFPRGIPATMNPASLELLACPVCHGDLELSGNYSSGSLTCRNCQRVYAVIDGIPRFAPYEQLSGLNQRFARLYDWFSHIYRPFSKAAFALIGGSENRRRREIIDKLEPHGGRVLEISIGPGVNLPYLVGQPGVGAVSGLDISVGQLKRCQYYAKQKSWDVDLFQGDAETLPFKDDSFESVFHLGGINFFNDKKKAIDEMIRVAKPGAKIVIGDETERGARAYELLPGFKRTVEGEAQPIHPPVDMIPAEMEEIKLDTNLWNGWLYCIEFRKPQPKPILNVVRRRTRRN